MKTDSIFYQLFQAFPSIFFELIGQPSDVANNYQFKSVEIKQTAFRIDGVFIPLSHNSQKPVYFVEVQFQKDPKFYQRFFAEIFLYLHRNELTYDWCAVVVYPKRSIEPDETRLYRALLASPQVQRVYLDELGSVAERSVGLGIMKLVIEPEKQAATRVRDLIDRAREEIADEVRLQELIELIETIVVYKFPQKSRQEIEAMFGLSELKQTKVYREAKEEGKLEAVPRLLKLGLSAEQIAEALDLTLEQVRQIASK